jgi:hypothetical protein
MDPKVLEKFEEIDKRLDNIEKKLGIAKEEPITEEPEKTEEITVNYENDGTWTSSMWYLLGYKNIEPK